MKKFVLLAGVAAAAFGAFKLLRSRETQEDISFDEPYQPEIYNSYDIDSTRSFDSGSDRAAA